MHPRTSKQKLELTTHRSDAPTTRRWDQVAVEEPLEIKLVGSDRRSVNLATVLRTPGHDFELAAGFLFSEGLIERSSDIRQISFCQDRKTQTYQVLNVHLTAPLPEEAMQRMRKVVTHGGCGACSMPALPEMVPSEIPDPSPPIASDWLRSLPEKLSRSMPGLAATGGVHAAALCRVDDGGEIEHLYEDIGRHNAVDTLVGHLLLKDRLPAASRLLLLSGRAGFELLQKASRAGISAVASLGAPTTMSVQWARQLNITLIGFLSEKRFNVYHGSVD